MASLARARSGVVALILLLVAAGGCTTNKDVGMMRLYTDDFEFRVTPDVVPPRALERITYTIVVKDKKTSEPVVNGEGRIFASNADGVNTWNGFTYGPEVGTYRATMTFVTAGQWALGIQFRRDSTQALQRTADWRQQVGNERAPGEP